MGRRHGDEPVADIVLPITPMLDMAFQLLTFFIFTYHPSAMEGQMALTLPNDADNAAKKQEDIKIDQVPKSDDLPEPVIELVILVKPSDQGGENPIVVEENTIRTPMADTDALKKHLKILFDRRKEAIENDLKTVPADKRDDERKARIAKIGIKVHPTNKVKWGEVVRVMDACRASGFTSVSFAKPVGYDLQ
jgi:biopolymer transport protein ExbD